MHSQYANKPKILLLSAYHADSHAAWANALTEELGDYEWTVLTLAPRYFAWRVRGNSLSWAFGEQRAVLEQPYDLVLATSMVDLSALRGFCPNLAKTPTLVYFHENQFAYPVSGKEHSSVEPQLLSIYTALCADRVVFNSEFNRASYLSGVRALLKRLPDQVPKGLVEKLESTSGVLPVPVGLEPDMLKPRPALQDRPVRLVWSARWEFDKGPERLFLLLNQLNEQGIEFELAVLGQSFRKVPDVFGEIESRYARQLKQFGYATTREAYIGWLDWADLVISTSLHEFQGLAVIEAVSRGALPLVPGRQVYPELFAKDFIYASHLDSPEREARAAADKLKDLIRRRAASEVQAPDVSRFSTERLIAEYRDLIQRMIV